MAKGMKTGGRVAGTGNVLNRDVKEMVLQALSNAGGMEYLLRLANEDPKSFIPLVGKCMPSAVESKVEHSGKVELSSILNELDGTSSDLPADE